MLVLEVSEYHIDPPTYLFIFWRLLCFWSRDSKIITNCVLMNYILIDNQTIVKRDSHVPN